MQSCIIVDDEEQCRTALAALLAQWCPDVVIAAQTGSLSSAMAAIRRHSPDIVFLDIELSGASGFDLLEALHEPDFGVIFTTGHNEYAVRAFRHAALDYLLKPIQPPELIQAVQRSSERGESSAAALRQLQRQLLSDTPQRLALPTSQGFTFVAIPDILRCEAEDNYTRFHFHSAESLIASRNIGEYDKTLTEHNFMRVHKSHLVNLDCVRHYIKGRGGSLILSDGSTVDVSVRKRDEFLRRFMS